MPLSVSASVNVDVAFIFFFGDELHPFRLLLVAYGGGRHAHDGHGDEFTLPLVDCFRIELFQLKAANSDWCQICS